MSTLASKSQYCQFRSINFTLMTDRNRYVQISGIIKLLGKHIWFFITDGDTQISSMQPLIVSRSSKITFTCRTELSNDRTPRMMTTLPPTKYSCKPCSFCHSGTWLLPLQKTYSGAHPAQAGLKKKDKWFTTTLSHFTKIYVGNDFAQRTFNPSILNLQQKKVTKQPKVAQ